MRQSRWHFSDSVKSRKRRNAPKRRLASGADRVFCSCVPSQLLPFSAVLLAGGKSTRMGFDKAGLIIDGQPLWRRQLATLSALEPQALFISGRPDGPYIGSDVPVIFDAEPGLGPIGGLAAALHHTQHSYLLVLAVDLPGMTPDFLRRLVYIASGQKTGAAPYIDGRFEPLAAVYPKECAPLAGEYLRGGTDRSLQGFIRAAVACGMMTRFLSEETDRPLFLNLNTPQAFGPLIKPLDTQSIGCPRPYGR